MLVVCEFALPVRGRLDTILTLDAVATGAAAVSFCARLLALMLTARSDEQTRTAAKQGWEIMQENLRKMRCNR
jgi:hypothetical protein